MHSETSLRASDIAPEVASAYTASLKAIAAATGLRVATIYCHRTMHEDYPRGLRIGSKLMFRPDEISQFYKARFGYEPSFV